MRVINPTGLCVNHVHGEGQTEFLAVPGTWLCSWCVDSLRSRCLDLAKMWPVLEAALHPAAGPQEAGARATRTAAPLPLNVDAVDLMQLAAAKARAIMAEIVEKRGVRVPDETTPGLLDWVGRWQLSWAAAWPEDSLVLGIWDDVAELWSMARPFTGRATVVLEEMRWQCIVQRPAPAGLVRCEGKLLRAIHSEARQETDIRCSVDKAHRWPASEWLHLLDRARILGQEAARARGLDARRKASARAKAERAEAS